MTPPDPDVLKALDRIGERLDRTAADTGPIDVNALSVDDLVALQERDPAAYQRSIEATAATPTSTPSYAEAPAGVIPAGLFNALRGDQLADVMAADPELYQRTVEHWNTHDQETTAP